MIGTILSLLLAIFKVVPKLKELWDELNVEYFKRKVAEMSAENRAAIRKAFDEFDQRELERVSGNPNAGGLSGLPDTVVVDPRKLPGVVQDANEGGT